MKKGNTKILDYRLDKAWPENNLLEIEITGESHPFVYLLMNSPGELFLENWINQIELIFERTYPMTSDGMKEQFREFCIKELQKHNMIKY